MTRIASFVPTGTEWMYALGLEERLVSVTYECDVPVRALVEKPIAIVPAEGRRGYRVDEKALVAAAPDTLLCQSLCDVCAASHAQVANAKRALGYAPRLIELAPSRLDEIPHHAIELARNAGAPGAGDRLARELADRIAAVRRAVAGRERPRVVALEWTDPPMAAGHWIPDMIEAAGAHDPLGAPGKKSRVISWNDVHHARPHTLLVMPCGVKLDGSLEAAKRIAREFPHTPILAFDASRYFARSGPSAATAVEMLAHALHPNAPTRDAGAGGWARVR